MKKLTVMLGMVGLLGTSAAFAQAKKKQAPRKVVICHKTTGKHPTSKTMRIDESAMGDHMSHGDTTGACPLGSR